MHRCVGSTDEARLVAAGNSFHIQSRRRNKPSHPVAKALVNVSRTFNLTAERLNEIIDGMEMDLNYNRYADFDTLRLYCYHVASVVGLCSAEIFGYRNPQTLNYAENLGLAFQLTNIIRDVGEDARRNRVYLPQDELVRFGVHRGDILHSRETENFRRLMEFQMSGQKTIMPKLSRHCLRRTVKTSGPES